MSDDKVNYPKSIGIIMDGNRRWARERGLPTIKGHEAGYKKVKEVLRWAKEFGVFTIYLYAFSTENWHRPKKEVAYLMKLFLQGFGRDAKELIEEKFRIKFIGQIDRFSPPIRLAIKKLEKATAKFSGGNLAICFSYGGRAEIIEAIKKIAREKGDKEIGRLTEEEFSKHLWTAGLPEPELVIRTSGEIRTSNFLPWQTAYSEWFFTKTFWPAFSKKELEGILSDFSKREIRHGK